MNKKFSLILLFTTLTFGNNLKENIDFGFVNTAGNTRTLNLNAKYDCSLETKGYSEEDFKFTLDTAAFSTTTNDIQENEEYQANLLMEQTFHKNWVVYSSINWLKNRFINFDNKTALGLGVGATLFDDGSQLFKIRFGGSRNLERYTNQQPDHDFTSFNQYMEYNNHLNKISEFFFKFGALENFDSFSKDYQILSSLGFKVKVAERLTLNISEEIRYNHLPPVGFKKADTKSIISLGYHF